MSTDWQALAVALQKQLDEAREEITEAWHQGAYGERTLWDCLGMSEEEYGEYLAKGLALPVPGASEARAPKPIEPGSIWYSQYLDATFEVLGASEIDQGLWRCQKVADQTHQPIEAEPYLFPDYEFGDRLVLIKSP